MLRKGSAPPSRAFPQTDHPVGQGGTNGARVGTGRRQRCWSSRAAGHRKLEARGLLGVASWKREDVSALEEDLATWKAKLDKALAREQKDADDAAASAAREAELAEKRRQADALAAEIKRLEGK